MSLFKLKLNAKRRALANFNLNKYFFQKDAQRTSRIVYNNKRIKGMPVPYYFFGKKVAQDKNSIIITFHGEIMHLVNRSVF